MENKSEFTPTLWRGQYPGMGGQLTPEWGVRIVRNLHFTPVPKIGYPQPCAYF
jgi:hypothetical protein